MSSVWREDGIDPYSILELVDKLVQCQISRSGIKSAAQRVLKHRAFSILLGYNDSPLVQVENAPNARAY